MSSRRRSIYTRASDVTIRDATTGEPLRHQRRYSPSELNTIRTNRNHDRVHTILAAKTPNPLLPTYLKLINAEN